MVYRQRVATAFKLVPCFPSYRFKFNSSSTLSPLRRASNFLANHLCISIDTADDFTSVHVR